MPIQIRRHVLCKAHASLEISWACAMHGSSVINPLLQLSQLEYKPMQAACEYWNCAPRYRNLFWGSLGNSLFSISPFLSVSISLSVSLSLSLYIYIYVLYTTFIWFRAGPQGFQKSVPRPSGSPAASGTEMLCSAKKHNNKHQTRRAGNKNKKSSPCNVEVLLIKS